MTTHCGTHSEEPRVIAHGAQAEKEPPEIRKSSQCFVPRNQEQTELPRRRDGPFHQAA